MTSEQQSGRMLHSALLDAGFDSLIVEQSSAEDSGICTLNINLGIPEALQTIDGGDVVIMLTSHNFGRIASRLLNVPERKLDSYCLACNALNETQEYIKYSVTTKDLGVYAERDFFYSDDSFCQRVIAFLPIFKEGISDAYKLLALA